MPLFASTSARVTVRQNGSELSGRKGPRGYSFDIECQLGSEVEVEFANLLTVEAGVTMVANAIDDVPEVKIPVGGSHVFRFTPTENVDQSLLWNDERSALLHFRVAAS